MQLVGKRNRRIIIAHLARLRRILARQRNTVVNIQDAILATWAPNRRCRLHLIRLGVHESIGERTAARHGHARRLRLAGVLAEVVRRDEAAGYAGVETCPAVVGGFDNGVLETAGVLEVQVQLAVLGAVGGRSAGADIGLEGVEAVGYNLFGK